MDNAAVETFFKTIKAELIWRHTWETRRSAEMAIFEYINGFYNPRPSRDIASQYPAGQWTSLNIGLEKPRRFRTESGLNEHLGRNKSGTGPIACRQGLRP